MKQEAEALERAIPEWKDPQAARRGKEQLASYLKSKGYTAQQINGVTDHRVVALAYNSTQGETQKSRRRPLTRRTS